MKKSKGSQAGQSILAIIFIVNIIFASIEYSRHNIVIMCTNLFAACCAVISSVMIEARNNQQRKG